MSRQPEKEALEAYLRFLRKKGAASGVLYSRSMFLDILIADLADKPRQRTTYGLALYKALKHVSQDELLECQNTAREFYPFWMEDLKAIAAFEQRYGFDIQPILWKPLPATLEKLTEKINIEFFDNKENLALAKYTQHLMRQKAEKLVIETRIKLAKIILLRLRDAPVKNNKTYRMAVDATLPLFKVKEIRELFLMVVREFFYIWTDAMYPTRKPRLRSDQSKSVSAL